MLIASSLFIAALSGSTLSGALVPAKDIDAFRDALTTIEAEEAQQAQDVEDEAGTEFFPVTGSGVQPDDGAAVTVTWQGRAYPLTDVPTREWFAPYVRDMIARGIVSGYRDAMGKPTGAFGPANPVSIEETAKMALAAAGVDPSGCAAPKNAFAAKSWSAQYIGCAEERKLSVFVDGSVDVRRPALRGEVVTTILEAFGVTPDPVTETGASLFTDVLPSTQFAPAILRAATDGVIAGYKDAAGNLTGLFGPDRPIARAEVAKVLSLAIQVYGELK